MLREMKLLACWLLGQDSDPICGALSPIFPPHLSASEDRMGGPLSELQRPQMVSRADQITRGSSDSITLRLDPGSTPVLCE